MKHCVHCDRQVNPTKFFSFGWFLLWFLVFGFGWAIYLVYYFLFKKNQCPICRGTDFSRDPNFVPWHLRR